MASDSSGPLPSPIVAAAAAATTTVTGAPISSSATKMTRTCSLCGNNGHNSRTCTDSSSSSSSSTAATGAANGGGGIMLFGVRVTEGSRKGSPLSSPFRKSASMTNLSQLDHQPHDSPAADAAAAGYASDDTLHAAGRIRERKRGVAWTENEHRLFLLGLQKVGKGDWRGISRNFVKTRTPTQVASHAQKYFLRRSNLNRRRRRSSLFDITTDTVMSSSSVEEHFHREGVSQSKPPIPPPSLKMADLNLNESPEPIPIDVEADESFPLSLSLPPSKSDEQSAVERRPAFPPVGFSGSGDGISVA